jgi:hypothetical protein
MGPEPEIRIIPNPVKDEADIVMKGFTGNDLNPELFDMNGRNVRHLTANSSAPGDYRIRFSRGSLHPGNYLLVLVSNRGILAKKSLVID